MPDCEGPSAGPGEFCGLRRTVSGERMPTRETDAREERGADGSQRGPTPVAHAGGGVASNVSLQFDVALSSRLFAVCF